MENGRTIKCLLPATRTFKEALCRKCPDLVNRKDVLLQHDTARARSEKQMPEKIWSLGWEIPLRPPYSLDLASTDFHLFRSQEYFIRNKEVQNSSTNFFSARNFKHKTENLTSCETAFLEMEGDYIFFTNNI